MGYIITKIENQEINIDTAQLFGSYTDDKRLFNGLKIVRESFLVGKDPSVLPDTTYYISATILYQVKENQIVITGEGGIDKVERLVIPVDKMNINLATFKQYVIDVNGGASGGGGSAEVQQGTGAPDGGTPITPNLYLDTDTGFFYAYSNDSSSWIQAGMKIYGEYGSDALAAAGGVPIDGIYTKDDISGFGGLLAIRRT